MVTQPPTPGSPPPSGAPAPAANPGSPTAEELFQEGNRLNGQGAPDLAASCYRRALALAPGSVKLLYNLATTLGRLGDPAGAADLYRQALDQAPDLAPAHHGLGAALRALGRPAEAVASFRRALELDPGFSLARRDLGAAFRLLVPRWHFAMLNDQARNQAYQNALARAVQPGMLVLDIGAGSGLLSLLAIAAGAEKVYACEMSPLLAAKAREIVAANHLSERIQIIPQSSLSLQIGRDLPRPADLLVTEIFDAGLLGEGVIPTLNHARRWLLAPQAPVLPHGATVYAALVESPRLAGLSRAPAEIAGFNLEPFNEFADPGYFQAELARLPHQLLSTPRPVFTYDFQKPLPPESTRRLTFRADQAGRADAVAFWFTLHLDPQTSLSTAPDLYSHWTQAVQLLSPAPTLPAGGSLTLTAEQDHQGLRFVF
ncbi:MAG: tetratricopeptide repeat protein [Deltaproteobacteria bacterium]|nr:tetratricopeptide repeat protein [Deltaproteobacteria bacterium]MCB2186324.1 tetratricopeptide repeat protein [Deltaproteobacteria bacterium]